MTLKTLISYTVIGKKNNNLPLILIISLNLKQTQLYFVFQLYRKLMFLFYMQVQSTFNLQSWVFPFGFRGLHVAELA